MNETMIRAAFKGCGREFIFSYDTDMGIEMGGDCVISARVGKQIGNAREGRSAVTDFTLFSNFIEEGIAEKLAEEVISHPHPLNREFLRSMDIPVRVQTNLKSYLKAKKVAATEQEKKKKKKNEKKKQSTKKQQQQKRNRSPPKSPPQATSSTISPIPNQSPTQPTAPKKTKDTSTAELIEEYERLQTKLVELRSRIKSRLAEESIEEEIRNITLNISKPKTIDNTITENNDNTLYYIHKSMVGKAVFDSTGAITINEIQAGLLVLSLLLNYLWTNGLSFTFLP